MNNMDTRVIGESFPRLHVMLLDLGNATFRKYGGAGFSISGPTIKVEVYPSDTMEIHGTEYLDPVGQEHVICLIDKLHRIYPDKNATFTILDMPKQHSGLGTKTSLFLNMITTYRATFNLPLEKTEIQILSERGGTSGVGINSFFTGGFIIDGGQPADRDPTYSPSSFSTGHSIPPIITHSLIPSNWLFYLLDINGKNFSGKNELELFTKSCPIPPEEILYSISLAYHGLAPAVIQNNIYLLKEVVGQIQQIGFKKCEIENQSTRVRETIKYFNRYPDCAVGLSSTGPLVYIIGDEKDNALNSTINEYCSTNDIHVIGKYKGNNSKFNLTAL